MRLVARAAARERIRERGGVLYVWPRPIRCCGGTVWSLEASTERPDRELALLHAEDGIAVYAPPGLLRPRELHVELERRERLAAYWNDQALIG